MLGRRRGDRDGQIPPALEAAEAGQPATPPRTSSGRRFLLAGLAIAAAAALIATPGWLAPSMSPVRGEVAGSRQLPGSGEVSPSQAEMAGSPPATTALPATVSGATGPTWVSEADATPGSVTAIVAAAVDPEARHHVPVLTYHVIAPWAIARAYSTRDLAVSPERFKAHLDTLRDAGWRSITAGGLAQALASGHVPPRNTFVITIDDGYDDGFVYALPLLRAHGFIATYYVVPGRLGSRVHLDWDQVRALAAAGMEIGNHTLDHVSLVGRPPSEVARQVAEAQAAIERETGQAPTTFAYPFGDFSPAVAAAVEEAGLHLAFTTRGGTRETWATRFTLPRVHVGATLLPESLLKVMAGFE